MKIGKIQRVEKVMVQLEEDIDFTAKDLEPNKLVGGKLLELTKEYRDRIPPSPLLSALNAIITYFTVVCNVKVQMIHDSAPSIYSSKGIDKPVLLALTIAFIT